MWLTALAILSSAFVSSPQAKWVVLPPTDARTSLPSQIPADAKVIAPGDKWQDDNHFHWVIGDLQVPEQIDGKPVAGHPVGLRFNCGDGGEVWLGGKLQARYDNDRPALVLISPSAHPGDAVRLAAQVYAKVQGGDHFSEAAWVLIDEPRAVGALTLTLDGAHPGEKVPDGIIGLSQGGGMSDYDAATAKKLKEGGFKWFRMDNVLTPIVKRDAAGKLTYDWTDLDRRVDFIHSIGADAIFAASYMPQPFDAIPDNERHSAPADYNEWEELCNLAARRCADRGKPVAFWEVWNEVNAGWLKPGPKDTGAEPYAGIYREAIGKQPKDADTVRRFEAYCKLYRATALGVRKGDPAAKVGGPVLASGPFDDDSKGPGVNGRGFARGLMLFCAREKLPLDFVSWHEYFQPADKIALEVKEMRRDLSDLPQFPDAGKQMILSEWNEAWWPDRPHDSEIGAAWCADCVTRCFIPEGLRRPCLFYVKQGDDGFRGDWSILMKDNVPKATYNMAKVFNGLKGQWIEVKGTDDEVSAVAAWNAPEKCLRLIVVNFKDRYNLRRSVHIAHKGLPAELEGGAWRRWTIDATHSNVWNDRSHAELEQTGSGAIGTADLDETLEPNSVTLYEFEARR
ncbi:MAG TPA: hypothetical protein VFE47_23200 [Tepidisphaeraceae bacterium]|jgi:hypothetical protein|nr:hypothetical protein [Tepidisphaeraceae bacterium]